MYILSLSISYKRHMPFHKWMPYESFRSVSKSFLEFGCVKSENFQYGMAQKTSGGNDLSAKSFSITILLKNPGPV